jgi:hypothetical protein
MHPRGELGAEGVPHRFASRDVLCAKHGPELPYKGALGFFDVPESVLTRNATSTRAAE